MDAKTKALRNSLRAAGYSKRAIDAAWPSWWTDEAEASPSARAELRFALSRNLGLSAKALVGERVEFVWPDTARYKHLTDPGGLARQPLNSFGVSVGRALLSATAPQESNFVGIDASSLRQAILADSVAVDLLALLSACWGLGVPVAHLRVPALRTKSMHAMVISDDERHAILMSRDASFPANVAFTLAHEIGHVALGHVRDASMFVDAVDPATAPDRDDEELAADQYALELLTGSRDPIIEISSRRFNHAELFEAVTRVGPEHRIDPGTLALVVAYQYRVWPIAMAAMRLIYPKTNVWTLVNQIAIQQLDLSKLTSDQADFVVRVLGVADV